MPPKQDNLAARLSAIEKQLSKLATPSGSGSQKGAKPKQGKGKQKKSKISGFISKSGEVEISKTELLGSIKVDANKTSASGSYKLQVSDIPYLKKLGACFERIQWFSLRVMYKPATSMTQAGLVSMGMDWNWSNAQNTRKTIACYTPTATNAVWKENSFTCPRKMLQSRAWYSTQEDDTVDAGPGLIAWAVDAAGGTAGLTVGEIWIVYKVVLAGTVA